MLRADLVERFKSYHTELYAAPAGATRQDVRHYYDNAMSDADYVVADGPLDTDATYGNAQPNGDGGWDPATDEMFLVFMPRDGTAKGPPLATVQAPDSAALRYVLVYGPLKVPE